MDTFPNTPSVEETVPSTKTRSNVPSSDLELLSLAKNVVINWDETLFKLNWLSKADFGQYVTDYETVVTARLNKRAKRSPVTQRLRELDILMNTNIENVKAYIVELYGKQVALSYYGQFGIVKEWSSYKLPHNRQDRLNSLTMLLDAITQHNMTDRIYGTQFWQQINDEYSTLVAQTYETDGTISTYVSEKRQQKDKIKRVLNSLLHLIRAQHPDDYRSVYRSWGFQKEKY